MNHSDLIKDFNRMCDTIDQRHHCNVCPIGDLRDDIEEESGRAIPCFEALRFKPDEFADIVQVWCKSNPPKVFCRIGELVYKICQIQNIDWQHMSAEEVAEIRLTEESADYFGIQPINQTRFTINE